MNSRLLALTMALVSSPRSAITQSAADTSVCYRLSYPGEDSDRTSESFAEYIEIQTAHDKIARSGVGPAKSQDFWRMFLIGGTWEREADTLIVDFTNGFSDVRYKLRPAGKDSLSGHVAFLYDVIDQRPPPSPVIATKLRCNRAHLQSPPYTQADADEARRTRRIQELQDAEERRIQAISTPLAGTYEFTITLPDARDIKVYARTESHPAGAFWHLEDQWNNPPEDTIGPYHAEGYRLRMLVSYREDALPLGGDLDNDRNDACTASLSVSEQSSGAPTGLRTWRGDNDVLMAAARCTHHGPGYDALLRACDAVSDVWFKHVPGKSKGEYTLAPDGSLTVSLEVARRGVTAVNIQGRRIATTVLSRE